MFWRDTREGGIEHRYPFFETGWVPFGWRTQQTCGCVVYQRQSCSSRFLSLCKLLSDFLIPIELIVLLANPIGFNHISRSSPLAAEPF